MDIIKGTLKDKSVSDIIDIIIAVTVLAMPDACTRLLLASLCLYGYYRGQNMAKGEVKDSVPIITPNRSDSLSLIDSGYSSLSSLSGNAQRPLVKDDYSESSVPMCGKSTPEQDLTKDSGIECVSNYDRRSGFASSMTTLESCEEDIECLNLDEVPWHAKNGNGAISNLSTNNGFLTCNRSSISGNQLGPILDGDTVSNAHLLNPILRTHLEEMEEFNIDLQEMIDKGLNILSKKQDGAIKELKQSIGQEFGQLKDKARRTRYVFKLEARRQLNSEAAEEVVQDRILQQNLRLVCKAAEVIKSIDEYVEARGLNLLECKAGNETKILWPTFNGQTLPLIADFLFEMEELMTRAAIPVCHRGTLLNQRVRGQAKIIIKNTVQELNPSFSHLADTLKTHFGETSTQMELIQRLHEEYGPIPAINDMSRPMIEVSNLVKGHIRLLNAAASLHQQYIDGHLKENPLTGTYLNIIERMLPREDRRRLPPEYYLMDLQEQFQEIHEIFKNTHHFVLTEVSRHGQQPYLTVSPAGGNGCTADSATTNPPYLFTGPPPMAPLFQPPPTLHNQSNNIKCFRSPYNMPAINSRTSPHKLTFPYPPPFIPG